MKHTFYPFFSTTFKGSFGMLMPQRSYNSAEYRFGFNGFEKDDEIKGAGNHLSFNDYGNDPRLARRYGNDPVFNPSISSYAVFNNNPIIYFDPDGEFPISIHIRSFAPFDWFGPGYLFKGDGDKRPFSTSANYTSRISQVTTYETETMAKKSTAFGSISSTKYGARANSDAEISYDQSYGNRIFTRLSGDDDATIPFVDWNHGNPTHDIDVWTDLFVDTKKNSDGSSILSITGDISGDGFPSSEAFVSDKSGNSVFLGAGPAKAGPIIGPIFTLAGDRNQKQFDVNVKISVGNDGRFNGVYSTDTDGKEIVMSPSSWNAQFESKDPKGTKPK